MDDPHVRTGEKYSELRRFLFANSNLTSGNTLEFAEEITSSLTVSGGKDLFSRGLHVDSCCFHLPVVEFAFRFFQINLQVVQRSFSPSRVVTQQHIY